MSYVKHTWVNNEVISASKLNNIEDGIEEASQSGGGGALICTIAYNADLGAPVMDKTVQEIYDALIGGTPVYAKYQYGVLGTDFSGSIYLAPVVKIYNYDNTSVIRVCVQKPTSTNAVNNYEYILKPTVAIFSATGLNQYPQYYTTVGAGNNYIAASANLD